ncbi:Histidine-containing phosphotransfer protein 3 [Glycine soja]
MDGIVQLQRQLVDYTASLFHEGFLDDQFNQLQQLQDESNPDFVVEVVTLFFEDAERLLNELTKTLGQPSIDFKRLDAHVHQLKGSSSSIGAQRIHRVCISFRNSCEEQNVEGWSNRFWLQVGSVIRGRDILQPLQFANNTQNKSCPICKQSNPTSMLYFNFVYDFVQWIMVVKLDLSFKPELAHI